MQNYENKRLFFVRSIENKSWKCYFCNGLTRNR